jgi:hypothetical protein
MSNAIKKIVDTYVRLNNRQALEDLKVLRQRLAVKFMARTGYDFSLPLLQVEDEIATIEAGLKRLAGRTQAALSLVSACSRTSPARGGEPCGRDLQASSGARAARTHQRPS